MKYEKRAIYLYELKHISRPCFQHTQFTRFHISKTCITRPIPQIHVLRSSIRLETVTVLWRKQAFKLKLISGSLQNVFSSKSTKTHKTQNVMGYEKMDFVICPWRDFDLGETLPCPSDSLDLLSKHWRTTMTNKMILLVASVQLAVQNLCLKRFHKNKWRQPKSWQKRHCIQWCFVYRNDHYSTKKTTWSLKCLIWDTIILVSNMISNNEITHLSWHVCCSIV